jgi:Pyruvate/2-oxoacid:ferredoxin oxidoreductase delta subunit
LVKRKIVEIDEKKCNGCGLCIPNCAEGVLKIIDKKARLVSDVYCDGLGACLGHCPQDAISIIEREAPEFNEEAVESYLFEQAKLGHDSSKMEDEDYVRKDTVTELKPSALNHWPVQLNLVPIKATFFEGADLLLISDCVAVALPNLHEELIKGRSVVMGCPKFDDTELYVKKLTDILNFNNINTLTVAVMEVPCCSSLKGIAHKALIASSKTIQTRLITVSVDGEIIRV